MLEPMQLVEHSIAHFQPGILEGKKIAITAGPTQEAIDPVRFISNHSSGKMGFALAEQAANLGAEVTLISGPVNLPTPAGVARIDVLSAQEMFEQLMPMQPTTISLSVVRQLPTIDLSRLPIRR
ncbi:phosphopantothenoylcysteine decarboxylase [Vibrio sp. JCM 19236]|nr:phosphopantothenoylcysteine decarboxylase [Vibrio sp. JCM 19236]